MTQPQEFRVASGAGIITPEQQARMEANRKKALARKQAFNERQQQQTGTGGQAQRKLTLEGPREEASAATLSAASFSFSSSAQSFPLVQKVPRAGAEEVEASASSAWMKSSGGSSRNQGATSARWPRPLSPSGGSPSSPRITANSRRLRSRLKMEMEMPRVRAPVVTMTVVVGRS